MDMPKVMLRSVHGTIFMCSRPNYSPVSQKVDRDQVHQVEEEYQQKIVRASGAMSLLLP